MLALPGPRLRRRLLLIALAALALCAAYTLWFRHSSLVAVDEVEVRGLSFAEQEITAALEGAAAEMTTLDADAAELERALERFPTVAGVSVDAEFPHRLVVEVTERAPVATVAGVSVAGDGTILEGVGAGDLELPAIEADAPPSSGRLDGTALAQAEILGVAPDPLRAAIRESGVEREHGVVIGLEGGIELRFGDSRDAEAKWAAAAAVLADPKLDELAYIDLRLPGRPAVGGAPMPVAKEPEAGEPLPAAPLDPAAAIDPVVAPEAVAPTVPAPAPVAEPEPAPSTTEAPAPAPASGVAGATAAP
jgi:cell division septal protein FtsQ